MKQIKLSNMIVLAGFLSLGSHATLCASDWRTKADDIEHKIRSLIDEFKNDAPVYQALGAEVEPYASELTMRKTEADELSTFITTRFDEIQKDIADSTATEQALDQASVEYEAQIALLTTLLAAKQTELESKIAEYNAIVGDDAEKAAFLLTAINALRNEYDNLTIQRAELIKKISAIQTALENFVQAEGAGEVS